MKEKAFVIMRSSPTGWSFRAITPYCVFEGTRKEAALFIKEKNKKSKRCIYYVVSIKKEKTCQNSINAQIVVED